jgi:hypothetical protein
MSSAFATDNDVHDHHDTISHPDLHLALDLRGALASHDDDADTASQHSISFSSSPATSPRDSTFTELSIADASRRPRPYIVSTESSEPDDASLYNGRSSSVTSPATPSLDGSTKLVPPTPLTAALRNNVYPPAQIQSPGNSSVASFETTTSSYSKKVRPESLLPDPPKGPLVLGIALVDFNHQVMLLKLRQSHSQLMTCRLARAWSFLLGASLKTRTKRLTKSSRFWPSLMGHISYVNVMPYFNFFTLTLSRPRKTIHISTLSPTSRIRAPYSAYRKLHQILRC